MASFQAKIGWKRGRKIENKNCISVPFRSYLTGNIKFQKKRKKIKKNKKIPLWLHFMTKQVGKCREREKIKIVLPFPSDRTGNRKFQKKEKKIQKNQKIQLWLHFQPKQDGKVSEREKKNYRFVSFRIDVLEKIQEKQQKNSIN